MTGAAAVLLCVALFGPTLCHGEEDYVAGDRRVVRAIGLELWNNRWEIYDGIVDEFGEDFFNDEMVALLSTEDDPDSYSCTTCRAAIGGLLELISRGLSYEEMVEIGISVCYNVTDAFGWRGDVICDGIVNNYAPHVIYVLNTTDMSAYEVCEFFRECAPQLTNNKSQKNSSPIYRYRANTGRTGFDTKPKEELYKIVQFTDLHLDPKYDIGAPTDCNLPICCRDYWEGQGVAGEWGDYSCHMPVRTLEKLLEDVKSRNPDLIVYTGDSCNSAIWEETQEGQIQQTELIADKIREILPGVLAHYAEGNHDMYPTNMHYAYRPLVQEVQERLAEIWAPIANFSEDQIETMKHAAYYTQVLQPGLRIISYNGNYGFTDNFYGILLPESEYWLDMLNFLETSFNLARENGEMVLLITHHPQARGNFLFYIESVYDIIDRNGDLIIIQLTGHFHKLMHFMNVDDEFNATSVVLSSGSGLENSAYTVFYLDLETMIIQDAEIYYFDLKNLTDSGGEPVYQLMYSYQQDYDMEDLSPASFQDFTDRMLYDPELFDLYRYNDRQRRFEPEPCDDYCRYSSICNIRSTTDDRYQRCMDTMPFP